MEPQERPGLSAWPPIIIVILLATTSAFLSRMPLESVRPVPSGQGVSTSQIQDYDARLWQDPFGIVPRKAIDSRCLTLSDHRVCQDADGTGPEDSTNSKCVTISGHRVCEESADDDTGEGLGKLKELVAAKGGTVHIVYALVPGGNWVGADEYRRRTRYAILAGANQSEYYPDDPEHLGYVEANVNYANEFKTDGEDTANKGDDDDENRSEEADSDERASWKIRLPFEWLSLNDSTNRDGDVKAGTVSNNKPGSVLILWIDEESLGQTVLVQDEPWLSEPAMNTNFPANRSYPLSRLASLVSEIAASEEGKTSLKHTIIGPFSSTFLVAATTDPGRIKAKAILEKKDFQWFSPTATLPDDHPLLMLKNDEGQDSKRLSDYLQNFHRLITTDEKLAEALAAELKLRRISADEHTAIALVGLWDTAYSRELRKLIAKEIRNENGLSVENEDKVLLISYLRGVDGRLPGVDERENNAGNGLDGASKQIERPEGDRQVDYLRRLALDLKRRSDQDDLKIRAIGVFGDDYYDKLLALQALRPSFPGAVFFTTDLEASMLHPADNKYTRNLIVASAFDLTLKNDSKHDSKRDSKRYVQGDIPPFRYSYQTSQFLAAQVALNGHELPHLKDGKNASTDDPQPTSGHGISRRALLFEIGYSEPVLLASICAEGDSKVEISGTNEGLCVDKKEPRQLDLHRSLPAPPGFTSIFLLPAIVLVVLLAAMGIGKVRGNHLKIWIAIFMISLVLSISWYFLQNFRMEAREPYQLAHWLQGVSIWPGEVMRVLALVTAVLLTRRGLRLLREARDKVDRDFFDGSAVNQRGATEEESGIIHKIISVLRSFKSMPRCIRDSFKAYPALNITSLWCFYANGVRHWRDRNQEAVSVPHIDNANRQDIRSTQPVNICLPLWPRITLLVVIAVSIAVLLILLLGELPNTPTRGHIEYWLDKIVLIVAIAFFLILLALAVIESSRAVWFARGLKAREDWPDAVRKRFLPEKELEQATPRKDIEVQTFQEEIELRKFGEDIELQTTRMEVEIEAPRTDVVLPTPQKAVDHWIDVEVISRITDPIQRIIFYPFVVIAILVVARSPLFDAWNMPASLLLLFSLYVAMLVAVAVMIRLTAEDLRKRASLTITQVLLHAKTHKNEETVKQLEALLDYLRNLRRGAFRHFSQQPLVHALLTLVGSYSGIALLEYFRMSGI